MPLLDKKSVKSESRQKPKVSLVNLVVLGGVHVIVILGIIIGIWFPEFRFRLGYLPVMGLVFLVSGLAVVGLHRGLTHRSFKSPKWLEALFALGNSAILMGGPIHWVGQHRLHHKYSDTDLDVHSPRVSFWWAHVGWVLHHGEDESRLWEVTRDLQKNRALVWIQKLEAIPHLTFAIACFLIATMLFQLGPVGGLAATIWCVYVSIVVQIHTVWAINSVCHCWGYQNYATGDQSRNVWWLGLWSLGEAWHNNHHKFPGAANIGQRWFEIDLGYWFFRLLGVVGIVRNVRRQRYRKE